MVKHTSRELAQADLSSTARLARLLADRLPASCDLNPGEGDPNLWCVFEIIADRLKSIEDRPDVELATCRRARRLEAVK